MYQDETTITLTLREAGHMHEAMSNAVPALHREGYDHLTTKLLDFMNTLDTKIAAAEK